MRCLVMIIKLSLAYRAEPNSKDFLPKGVPFSETEFSEGKLCEVASPKLQETLPHLWRQVCCFNAHDGNSLSGEKHTQFEF